MQWLWLTNHDRDAVESTKDSEEKNDKSKTETSKKESKKPVNSGTRKMKSTFKKPARRPSLPPGEDGKYLLYIMFYSFFDFSASENLWRQRV